MLFLQLNGMETDFVYKMREILTMQRVSGRRSPKCGSLPRDAGDLVGLLGDMMLKSQFTVEQDSKIADNAETAGSLSPPRGSCRSQKVSVVQPEIQAR